MNDKAESFERVKSLVETKQSISTRSKPVSHSNTLSSAHSIGRFPPFPVLLYMVLVVLPIHTQIGPLALTGVRVVLLVTIIPLSINLLLGKYGRILWTDVLFFLHLFWAIVALGVNNPDQAIQFAGSVAIEFMGSYVLARAYIRTPEDFIAMCRLFFFLVVSTLPLALIESQTGTAILPKLIQSLPGISSVPDYYNALAGMRFGLNRTQVVFDHPIHYGLYSSVAFSLAFVGFKTIYGIIKRFLITGLIAASVFFSLSSGALLSVVLQAGLILWAWSLGAVRLRWVLLLAVSILIYIGIDLLSNRTPLKVFLSYATFSPRNGYWRYIIFEWGMKNVWANPIFGLGLNDWVRPWFMSSGSMDNFWLVNAVRYGLPGFLTLFVGYVIAIWAIGRRDFNNDRIVWQLRRAWVFTFIGLSFTLATVHVWATIFAFCFFLFGAGMWMVTYEIPKNTPTPSSEDDNTRLAFSRYPSKTEIPARKDVAEQKAGSTPLSTQGEKMVFTRFPEKTRVPGSEL